MFVHIRVIDKVTRVANQLHVHNRKKRFYLFFLFHVYFIKKLKIKYNFANPRGSLKHLFDASCLKRSINQVGVPSKRVPAKVSVVYRHT